MDTAERRATLKRIRTLSRLMDNAIRIPIIGYRIGLDAIIGLVPVSGDLVSAAFSAYIIFLAARFGLPRQIMRQMIFNVGLDTAIGFVPLLGDLFDSAYKSNIRNLALLEKHLQVVDPTLSNVAPSIAAQETQKVKKLGLVFGCFSLICLILIGLLAAIIWPIVRDRTERSPQTHSQHQSLVDTRKMGVDIVKVPRSGI